MTTNKQDPENPAAKRCVAAPDTPTDRAVRDAFERARRNELPIRAPLTIEEIRKLREESPGDRDSRASHPR